MKRLSAILIIFVLLLGIGSVAAGATPPAMDVISFDDGTTDGEMIVFEQGGALAVEMYDGCLSVVMPDIHSGFVTTEAYENFTIQFDVGGVSSSSCIAGISFGLESPDSVAMTDGHMMQINMDTLQLINYNNPDAPSRCIIAESIRGTCVGLDTYWPLSPDEWMVDTFTDEGEFKFGYKRNTYKLVKDGSAVRVYRKNNIISENAQEQLFELVNTGWVDVQEEAGYVRISFINSDEYLIDNVCFSPEPYADFPVAKNEPKPTDPTTPPTTEPTTPPATEPTTPPATDPTEPPVTEPTEPPVTDPTEPPATNPTEPEPTEEQLERPTDPPATKPADQDKEEPDDTAEEDNTLTWVLIGGGAALLVVLIAVIIALGAKKRRN